jgi:hypothetical protein
MDNSAIVLDLLKVDWEARRRAFELARTSQFPGLMLGEIVNPQVQTWLEFTPTKPESLEVPKRDS